MNTLFKESNLGAAFPIAAKLIEVVSSVDYEEKFQDFLGPQYVLFETCHDFIIDIISNNVKQIVKPQKKTLLHDFIKRFYEKYIYNIFSNVMEPTIWCIDEFVDFFEERKCFFFDCGLDVSNWEEKIDEKIDMDASEDEIQKILKDIQSSLLKTSDSIIDSIFYFLYGNKKFLYDFNLIISQHIFLDNLPARIFDENNHIKRVAYIPKWLENAILFRDKAMCQICGKDLSNSFRIVESGTLHFGFVK